MLDKGKKIEGLRTTPMKALAIHIVEEDAGSLVASCRWTTPSKLTIYRDEYLQNCNSSLAGVKIPEIMKNIYAVLKDGGMFAIVHFLRDNFRECCIETEKGYHVRLDF